MKILIGLFCLSSIHGFSMSGGNDFFSFTTKYKKEYHTETDRYHAYLNFQTNMETIHHKNKRQTKYRLGPNQFSDQNMDMIHRQILSNDFTKPITSVPYTPRLSFVKEKNIDWEKRGYVQPIKNQGNCGSCWAFSTISAIETMVHYYVNKEIELSEQQLIDCSDQNYGCNGGWMHTALDYIKEQGGVVSASVYPYKSFQQTCEEFPQKIKETSWFQPLFIPPNSPELLKNALVLNSICVAVHADFDFVFYEEGIFEPEGPTHPLLNHAVVLIGYDSDHELWRIRNSWGETWGEQGYMRLPIREGKGVAGIHSYAIFPMFQHS